MTATFDGDVLSLASTRRRLDAAMRVLVADGDMTPLAVQIISRVLNAEGIQE